MAEDIEVREVDESTWMRFLQDANNWSETEHPLVSNTLAKHKNLEIKRLIVYQNGIAVLGKHFFLKGRSAVNPVLLERHKLHFINGNEKRPNMPAFDALLEWCEAELVHFNCVGILPPWAVTQFERRGYSLTQRKYWTINLENNLLYHQKTIYGISKYQKEPGADLIAGGSLDDFFPLHQLTARSKGFEKSGWMETKRAMMAEWLEAGVATIFLALIAGVPAAGLFVLHGKNPVSPFAVLLLTGSNEDGKRSNAGAALHDFAARYLKDEGAKGFSLGQTGENTGLSKFRERLGAAPIQYYSVQKTYRPFAAILLKASSVFNRS